VQSVQYCSTRTIIKYRSGVSERDKISSRDPHQYSY